jgi:histidinol-phosphate phosphatase family protein
MQLHRSQLTERPRQAVILAGGRGTRLRPLTDTRPKPMIDICGKPFLQYQIEQLREQGFEKVLLLLGYLPEVVEDFFGDGGRWGIKIEYSVTDVADETGRRLKLAESFLDPCFLMMYCDNYWPMDFDRMWQRFQASGASAMITVYSNKDRYTRNSVRVEADGMVSLYDKSCSDPSLNGVEISYAIIDKEVMGLLNGDNCLFETAIYPALIQQKKLAGYVSDHRYYSVGGLHRLPLTESFFQRQKTVLIDRDGVLNRKPPRAEYVTSWNGFQWLPDAQAALQLLQANGFQVIVVSNQAGVARGAMTAADLDDIHDHMKQEAEAAGGHIAAIYHCPHDWDAGCQCRKPRAGMLFQAQREFDLDLSRTPFIGDDERDGEAAEAAGCPFIRVSETKTIFHCAQELIKRTLPKGNSNDTKASFDHRS